MPRKIASCGARHGPRFRATIGAWTRSGRRADTESGGDDRETAYDLLQRGQALLERRHFAQAAIVLERADRQEPAKGSILEALGRAYFNSGQAERARATFEALLEIEPSSHYAHYAIGQSLKRLGRPDRARTHLRSRGGAGAAERAVRRGAGAVARRIRPASRRPTIAETGA